MPWRQPRKRSLSRTGGEYTPLTVIMNTLEVGMGVSLMLLCLISPISVSVSVSFSKMTNLFIHAGP